MSEVPKRQTESQEVSLNSTPNQTMTRTIDINGRRPLEHNSSPCHSRITVVDCFLHESATLFFSGKRL